jgi:outer membrane protein TolC
VTATRAGGQPNVGAFVTYNGANAYRFASFSDNWEWHWNVGLAANWSIWDGNLTRGAVREKELQKEKAETDLDELRKAVRLEVRQSCIELAHSSEAVEASRGTVGMAEKALDIGRTRHEQGLATYLEFTDANVGVSLARLTECHALALYLKALARLKYATGMDDEAPMVREEKDK